MTLIYSSVMAALAHASWNSAMHAAGSILCDNGALDDYEDCDDNNLLNNDGCDDSCKVEEGYGCQRLDNTSLNPDLCTLLCGNGALEQSE